MVGHMPCVRWTARANDWKVIVDEKTLSVTEGVFSKKILKTIDKTLHWCYNTREKKEEHSVLTVPEDRASVNKAYAPHGSIGFVRSCFALFYLQFPQKGEQFGSRPVRQRYF